MKTLPYSHTNSTKFGAIPLNFMPSLYMNSVSSALAGWEDILYAYDRYVEDEEIWDVVRSCEEIPHIGNVYQSLVFGQLVSLFLELTGLEAQAVNIYTYVNGFDSHFCVNGIAINDEETFQDTVKAFKKLHRHQLRQQKYQRH